VCVCGGGVCVCVCVFEKILSVKVVQKVEKILSVRERAIEREGEREVIEVIEKDKEKI
jgi:hypothetical protein